MSTPSNNVLSERIKNLETTLGGKIDSLTETASKVFSTVGKHDKKWVSQTWINKIGLFLVVFALLANVPQVAEMLIRVARISFMA